MRTEAEFQFGVAAGVTARLPHPFGSVSTTATLTGPAEEDPDPPWELGPVAVQLSSGVEQPLGSLLGLDATDADDLEAAHAVLRAERALRQRTRAIAGEILDRIMTVIEGEKAQRRALFDLDELEAEVVRRREVFEENEDSHSFQSLLFAWRRSVGGLRRPGSCCARSARPLMSRPDSPTSARCRRCRLQRPSRTMRSARQASWMPPWNCG